MPRYKTFIRCDGMNDPIESEIEIDSSQLVGLGKEEQEALINEEAWDLMAGYIDCWYELVEKD